jgi:DNA-binding Lrp family transcriptional regulator
LAITSVAPSAALARLGVSRGTVQNRIDRLLSSGVLLGFTARLRGDAEGRLAYNGSQPCLSRRKSATKTTSSHVGECYLVVIRTKREGALSGFANLHGPYLSSDLLGGNAHETLQCT